MNANSKLQLVGGLRLGNPDDDSFYADLLARLPREVKNTGRITRLVAFDYLTDDENPITFLGIEVDDIETIPDGMVGWILNSHEFILLEAKNGRNDIVWRKKVTWQWCDDSASEFGRGVTGEFSVDVPQVWAGGSPSNHRHFTMSANIYISPGRKGCQDGIQLVKYDPHWPRAFKALSEWLRERLGSDIALRIEHHGSTSIPGMMAKPIIDVLVVVPSFRAARQRALPLLNDPTWEYVWYHNHMAFIKRDKFLGERVCHVHMMPDGQMFKRYLAFRDYLRSHPEDAAQYAALKQALAEKHADNREQYTNAKEGFVNHIVDLAMRSA